MMEETPDGSAYIRCQLDLAMVTGRYSSVLVTELMRCVEHRSANIVHILDEIGGLEGAPHSRPTRTKASAPFGRPLLSGLWHKHYVQAAFIPKNVLNHWGSKSKRFFDRAKAIMQDQGIPYEKKAGALSDAFDQDTSPICQPSVFA